MSKAKVGSGCLMVRLADGTGQYFCDETRRQGQMQWSPRETEAHRFATVGEAEQQASAFERNSAAKEYLVVPLPKR